MSEISIDDLSPDWRTLYERGRTAQKRQDWDAAIRLLNEVLEGEPRFYACREALREAQLKRAEACGVLKRTFDRVVVGPLLAEAAILVHAHPLKAILLAEQALNHAPDNFAAHHTLAKAALASDLPQTALLSLRFLHEHYPENHVVTMELAESFLRMGHTSEAGAVYGRLLKDDPQDQSALTALGSVARHAKANAGPKMQIKRSEAPVPSDSAVRPVLEEKHEWMEASRDRGDQIDRYEALLQHCPRNVKVLRTLAGMYASKLEFDRALACFQQALEVRGGHDEELENAIRETNLKRFDCALARFDHALARPDPQAPDHRERLTSTQTERSDGAFNGSHPGAGNLPHTAANHRESAPTVGFSEQRLGSSAPGRPSQNENTEAYVAHIPHRT